MFFLLPDWLNVPLSYRMVSQINILDFLASPILLLYLFVIFGFLTFFLSDHQDLVQDQFYIIHLIIDFLKVFENRRAPHDPFMKKYLFVLKEVYIVYISRENNFFDNFIFRKTCSFFLPAN